MICQSIYSAAKWNAKVRKTIMADMGQDGYM